MVQDKDMDIWLDAYQQACAIAFNIRFDTVEAYNKYVDDLTKEIYDALIEESKG